MLADDEWHVAAAGELKMRGKRPGDSFGIQPFARRGEGAEPRKGRADEQLAARGDDAMELLQKSPWAGQPANQVERRDHIEVAIAKSAQMHCISNPEANR